MKKPEATKKQKIMVGTVIFLFILMFNFVGVKLGLERGSSSLDPSTWKEYFSQLPKFTIIAAFVSYIAIYILSKLSLGTNYYMCTKCLEPTTTQETNNLTCVKCKGLLEPLDGFYERHPDLKKD